MELSVTIDQKVGMAALYVLTDRKEKAGALLDGQLKLAASDYISPYSIAQIYSVLNETDQAFLWLEKSFEARESLLVNLEIDPLLDNLRSDPRYAELKRRIGYWQ